MQTGPALFIVIWIAFYAYWLISAWKTRSPVKRRQSHRSYFLYGIVWIGLCIIIITVFVPGFMTDRLVPDGIGFLIAGLLLTVAGLAWAIWARLHLGKNWSGMPAIREQHTITRTGPYAIVRHPIYSGLILAFSGTAIGIGYLWIFCCIPLLFGLFVIKFRMEEKILLEEFGGEYARYRHEVKALIPFLL